MWMKKGTKKKIVKAVGVVKKLARRYGQTRVSDVVGLDQPQKPSKIVDRVVGLRTPATTVARTFGVTDLQEKMKKKRKR